MRDEAYAGGADAAVVSNHWAEGGAGARALAEALISTCEGPSQFKFLYDLNLSIEEKINIISKEIYGADGIELSELAKTQVETYTAQGYSNLASMFILRLYTAWSNFRLVCMAKTQYSFSHDPKLKGVPTGLCSFSYKRPLFNGVVRLHDPHPRRTPVRRCWVLIPHSRRHGHHAWTGYTARILGGRS